jgi:5-enolpyruvylshikimate-3-phosphate synthase
VLGLRTEAPTRVLGASMIDTSFPGFVETLSRIVEWR